MALEAAINEVVEITVPTVVEKIAVSTSKETLRFEVLLPTKAVRVDRIIKKFDSDGKEISATVNSFNFDYQELLFKSRNNITGLDIYIWLKAEFDERDPIN